MAPAPDPASDGPSDGRGDEEESEWPEDTDEQPADGPPSTGAETDELLAVAGAIEATTADERVADEAADTEQGIGGPEDQPEPEQRRQRFGLRRRHGEGPEPVAEGPATWTSGRGGGHGAGPGALRPAPPRLGARMAELEERLARLEEGFQRSADRRAWPTPPATKPLRSRSCDARSSRSRPAWTPTSRGCRRWRRPTRRAFAVSTPRCEDLGRGDRRPAPGARGSRCGQRRRPAPRATGARGRVAGAAGRAGTTARRPGIGGRALGPEPSSGAAIARWLRSPPCTEALFVARVCSRSWSARSRPAAGGRRLGARLAGPSRRAPVRRGDDPGRRPGGRHRRARRPLRRLRPQRSSPPGSTGCWPRTAST